MIEPISSSVICYQPLLRVKPQWLRPYYRNIHTTYHGFVRIVHKTCHIPCFQGVVSVFLLWSFAHALPYKDKSIPQKNFFTPIIKRVIFIIWIIIHDCHHIVIKVATLFRNRHNILLYFDTLSQLLSLGWNVLQALLLGLTHIFGLAVAHMPCVSAMSPSGRCTPFGYSIFLKWIQSLQVILISF